jgi:hypothetical protein
VELVRPETFDWVHCHLLPVFVFLDIYENLGELKWTQELPEIIKQILEYLGLLHELLLGMVELHNQLIVLPLLLKDLRLALFDQPDFLIVHVHVLQHLLPPLLVVGVELDCWLPVKIEVLAGRVDEELLAFRDECLQDLLEVVVYGFDSVFPVHSQTVSQCRNLFYHLSAQVLAVLL